MHACTHEKMIEASCKASETSLSERTWRSMPACTACMHATRGAPLTLKTSEKSTSSIISCSSRYEQDVTGRDRRLQEEAGSRAHSCHVQAGRQVTCSSRIMTLFHECAMFPRQLIHQRRAKRITSSNCNSTGISKSINGLTQPSTLITTLLGEAN